MFNNSKILSHSSYCPFHRPSLVLSLVHSRVYCTTALLPFSYQFFFFHFNTESISLHTKGVKYILKEYCKET